MLLIVGTVRLPAGMLEAARAVMREMVEASRAEDGCAEYVYAEDVLDAGLIHVKELWRDEQALARHFASAHLSRWREAWGRLQIAERNLRMYEVGAPRAV